MGIITIPVSRAVNQTGAAGLRDELFGAASTAPAAVEPLRFVFFFLNLKIFLAAPGLHWCVPAFSALLAGARSTVVQGLLIAEAPGQRSWALGTSGAVRRWLSCSAAREPFQPEVEPVCPASAGSFLPTAP